MTVLTRIYREPAALLGAVAAVLGILTLLSVLDEKLAGGILTAVGACVALLRYVVTPTAEVVVQQKPNGELVAGQASPLVTGTRLDSEHLPADAPPAVRAEVHRRLTEDGATTAGTAYITLLILGAVAAGFILTVLMRQG